MANPFVKGWRYMMALFGAKIDEYADPKVQIQQAIEDAQRQHQALVQQAAAVIGNQRQLEMKLSRQMSEVEKLQGMARQALVLADRARAGGDEAEAQKYESTATTLATQLVSGEQSMEDLKTLHDQALGAAGQARKAVENNAMVLQQRIAERSRLLSQLEQAKMQETVAKSLESMSSLAAPGNTRPWTRCATRSRHGTRTRWAAPSWRRTPSRAACSRCRNRASTWPARPGSSRSGPAWPASNSAADRPRRRWSRVPRPRPPTRPASPASTSSGPA
jgi:phage shock protein A